MNSNKIIINTQDHFKKNVQEIKKLSFENNWNMFTKK